MRRSRGRGGSGGHGGSHSGSHGGNHGGRRPNVPNRHHIFDSNGPDIRIRGTAWQVYEKYLALARDAQASGDRVTAENHLQHAEHYYRIILAISEAGGETGQPRPAQGRPEGSEEGVENAPASQGEEAPAESEQPSDEGLAANLQPVTSA